MRRATPLPILLAFVLACTPGGDGPVEDLRYRYRAIGGASMGAMGATMIGARHPDHFDAIGGLGGAIDFGYLVHYMQAHLLGGFCSYEDLLAHLDAPESLDDPAVMDACATTSPTSVSWEHRQRFLRWQYDDAAGGTPFDRDSYYDLFEDLSVALGNPLYHRDDDPFLAPGMTEGWTCDDPPVIRGYDSGGTAPFYNAEYNPEGRFDVVGFCDGHQPIVVCSVTGALVDFCAGDDAEDFCGDDGPPVVASRNVHPDVFYANTNRLDPCRPLPRPVPLAWAVDLNGNGRRDYGEPILVNAHERFEDAGAGGDPYHWLDNPLGTDGNGVWDPGEPFLDHGLDGVAGTGDHGEGDGAFTRSPNLENYFAHDPRTLIAGWSDETLATTDVWLDGGVRDVFNFGVMSARVFGALSTRSDEAGWYDDFESLPSLVDGWPRGFDFVDVDWQAIPRHVFLRYGDPDATAHRIRQGDGTHVGTINQAINRFNAFFAWIGERWPGGDYEPVDSGPIDELAFESSFFSPALGTDRVYAVALPPGYFDPGREDAVYPVVYFLHGYGGNPMQLLLLNLIFQNHMAEGILPKLIMVYADGRCCFRNRDTGELDCHEPTGREFQAPWRRECLRGSFYVNRRGRGVGDTTPYEESIFDLVRHVEATYRVAVPEAARLD